jgi:hypothetical protein
MMINSLQVFTNYLKDPVEFFKEMEKPLESNTTFKAQWINDAVSPFLLRKINIPHSKLLILYRKIVGVILYGYEQKEVDRTTVVRLLSYLVEKEKSENKALFSVNSFDTTLPSILVSGFSGSGKTKTIRTALSFIPQVIEHFDPIDGRLIHKQIVWLSFNCSPTMSMHGFSLNFFKAVDDLLGTDYFEQWCGKKRIRVDEQIINMQKVALIHSIGLMHVDELQFLIQNKSNKDSASISKVEAIFNEVKVPMLLSCTTQGLAWLKNSESLLEHKEITLVRRLCSDVHIEFELIIQEDSFFDRFIENFFDKNTLAKGIKAPDRFKKLFLNLTAGLIAVMTRLACLYIEMIQLREIDFYNEGELLRVFKANFKLYEGALEALRGGRFSDFEAEYIITQEQLHEEGEEDNPIRQPKVIPNKVEFPSQVNHLKKLNGLDKKIGVSFDDI